MNICIIGKNYQTLPTRESFYSNLNFQGISKSGYEHAKDVEWL